MLTLPWVALSPSKLVRPRPGEDKLSKLGSLHAFVFEIWFASLGVFTLGNGESSSSDLINNFSNEEGLSISKHSTTPISFFSARGIASIAAQHLGYMQKKKATGGLQRLTQQPLLVNSLPV
jgi:hypothetical protein